MHDELAAAEEQSQVDLHRHSQPDVSNNSIFILKVLLNKQDIMPSTKWQCFNGNLQDCASYSYCNLISLASKQSCMPFEEKTLASSTTKVNFMQQFIHAKKINKVS